MVERLFTSFSAFSSFFLHSVKLLVVSHKYDAAAAKIAITIACGKNRFS